VFHERLLILVGLVVGAMVGIGTGAILGDTEFFGILGALIGAAFGVAGFVRINNRSGRPPARSRPQKVHASHRRSKKRSR
jgi:F0F1-type ATP synthase assembly protein I